MNFIDHVRAGCYKLQNIRTALGCFEYPCTPWDFCFFNRVVKMRSFRRLLQHMQFTAEILNFYTKISIPRKIGMEIVSGHTYYISLEANQLKHSFQNG